MVYMALIRKKKNEILHPPPQSPKIPSIVADNAVNKHVNLLFEQKKKSIQALWSHLVFVKISNQKKSRSSRALRVCRSPTIVFGLFNQLFSLFAEVDITKILGRSRLYIGNFYVNFHNTKDSVPLSKIVQLQSLLVSTLDWDTRQEPTPSASMSLEHLQKQNHVQNLEIGCCFMFPLPHHNREEHVRRLRFHPIFYELISSFLQTYPTYQVVHYRMENDFSEYFYKQWRFTTHQECRQHLFQQYQQIISKQLNPTIPTLIVSHYYKDSKQTRDHDLQWKNLIHFTLKPQQKIRLCQHLQLPLSTPMREVDAVIDFILCTTPNVHSFIGCGGSTFSGSVCMFHNHGKKCYLVQPVKS